MIRRLMLIAVSFFAAGVLFDGQARAQAPAPDAVAAAKELVVTMRAADQIKQLMPIIMQQLKPAIVQGRADVDKDFDAVMPQLLESVNARSGEFAAAIADIYAHNFTAEELRQVTAFYQGPVGQKFLAKMPAIAQESLAMGQKLGQSIATELHDKMIEELRKRGHKI